MEMRSLLSVILIAASSAAWASDDSGFYLGSGAGMYYVDFDDVGFDETAASLRGFGGFKLNQYLAFEAGYTWMFESSGSVLGTDIDVDGTAWDLSVRPTWPVSDKVDFFGIVGWAEYDIDVAVNAGPLSFSDSEKDGDFMYGLGAGWDITDNWNLRGEWVAIDVSDADFGVFSVSATYNFR